MNLMTKPAPVNGIDVGDVQDLISAVTSDPAAGMTSWRVVNTWQGGTQSQARVEGFEIGGRIVRRAFNFQFDEPNEIGGTNRFANPQEYLLGALNACMIVGFTALCALHGYRIEQLEIVVDGEIDLRGFFGIDAAVSPGYDDLRSTLTVKGSATAEQFQQVFEMMLATSPNLHNISRPVRVTPVLVVG